MTAPMRSTPDPDVEVPGRTNRAEFPPRHPGQTAPTTRRNAAWPRTRASRPPGAWWRGSARQGARSGRRVLWPRPSPRECVTRSAGVRTARPIGQHGAAVISPPSVERSKPSATATMAQRRRRLRSTSSAHARRRAGDPVKAGHHQRVGVARVEGLQRRAQGVAALQRHRSRHPGVDDAAGEGPAPLRDRGVRRGQLGVEAQPGLGLFLSRDAGVGQGPHGFHTASLQNGSPLCRTPPRADPRNQLTAPPR